jgi:hypothetical protein
MGGGAGDVVGRRSGEGGEHLEAAQRIREHHVQGG